MKNFTKLFCVAAFGLMGLASANAQERVYADFSNATPGGNASWDANTNTFSWTDQLYSNGLSNIGLPNGDISKYKKIVVDCEVLQGEKFRILFYDRTNNDNLILWVENGVNEFNIKESLESLSPTAYNDYILACGSIILSGDSYNRAGGCAGSAIIKEVYMEEYPEGEEPETPEEPEDGAEFLTKEMFLDWTDADNPVNGYGAYELNTSTGLAYGDGNVSWKKYADLSAYSKLAVTVSAGAPRFCMNRTTAAGQDSEDESLSEMIDIPWNNGTVSWAETRYLSVEGNVYTIDLAQIVADKGYAYLHCIKGAYWGEVTVKSMKLYKDGTTGIETVEEAKSAEVLYDLQGRVVTTMGKGLFVKGGKVIMVK